MHILEIGQIYRSIAIQNDPFSEEYFVRIIEIKRNYLGQSWVKYRFVHPVENGTYRDGTLDSSVSSEQFYYMYDLLNVKEKDKITVEKQTAIEQLEP